MPILFLIFYNVGIGGGSGEGMGGMLTAEELSKHQVSK